MVRLSKAKVHIIRTWFLHVASHPCMKNKWFSLPVWLEALKIEIDNTTDDNSNDLIDTLLNVSNLKQSLKEIVHYNNKHNNSANPYGLYVHEDRPRVMIDGKSVCQSCFAVLSSKEKNKLPPKSNLNASNVIIDILPCSLCKCRTLGQ